MHVTKNMKKIANYFGKHHFLFIACLALVSIFILFLRRPDILLTPQFWAEDGKYWFGEAYRHGPLRSLLFTYAGSPQLMMRIIGSTSLWLPFAFVPVLFTCIAILVQIIPLLLIHSRRYRPIFSSTQVRWAISIVYLFMPNSIEVHANLTNVGWHLTLVSFLILIGPATKQRIWKVFDISFLVVGILTGPFSLLLLLPATLVLRKFRGSQNIRNTVIVSCGAFIQIMVLVAKGASERQTTMSSIGASASVFVQILGKRIFGVSLLGNQIALKHINKYLVILFFVTGALAMLYTFKKAGFYLRLFVGFCWLVLIATLISPAMGGSWLVQLQAVNDRYWFLPTLAFLISLVWLTNAKNVHIAFKYLAVLALASSVLIAVPASFRYSPLPDKNFRSGAKEFNQLKSGENICIEVNPDNGWLTCLTKK